VVRWCGVVQDFMQLLGGRVSLHRPASGGGGFQVATAASVRAEYGGITPQQFAEYLSLVGDSADNIPGVKGAACAASSPAPRFLTGFQPLCGMYACVSVGVGPVSASKLLTTYGSVNGILRACLALRPEFQSLPLHGSITASALSAAARARRTVTPGSAATLAAADAEFEAEWKQIVADATASNTASAAAAASTSATAATNTAAAAAAAPTPTPRTSGAGTPFRTKTMAQSILLHRHQLLRNRLLTAIRTDVAPLPDWNQLVWSGYTWHSAKPALEQYDLFNILSRVRKHLQLDQPFT
jgi:hypothetical protein